MTVSSFKIRTEDVIRIITKKAVFVAVFIAVFTVSFAGASQYPVDYEKKVLDNGATVVSTCIEDSLLETIQMRVRSGLSNEGKYASTGISHFLEHLLFKGTNSLGPDQLKKEIKLMGGVLNGSTGLDSAEYHITVPKENFEKAVNLLIDMVTELSFSEDDFESEKEVIIKEIKMHEDDPISRRMDLLFRQAYRTHIYKDPIIGYEDLFRKLTSEDVMEYHRSVYSPDRIVLGAAGGVPSDIAIKTMEAGIEKMQREKPWDPNVSWEPSQLTERTAFFDGDVALGYMTIGYHSTSIYSDDLYAGDILAMILGQGDDSRLNKRLVKEKQLLHSVSCINYTPKYPGLFIVTAIGDPEKMAEARAEIFSIIENIEKDGVSAEELQKSVNLAVAGHIKSQENIYNVTSSMTNSELLTGDPAFGDRYVEKIRSIDKEDVRDFAGKYLSENSSTTVTLLPSFYSGEKRSDKKNETVEKETAEKLANGLMVVVKERKRLPMVSVFFAANGGLTAENKKNNGISSLASSLIVKGTKTRSEDEIVPVVENAGGDIGGFSGNDSVGLYMNTLKEDHDKAMDIFEDVLKNAVFPEKEVKRYKRLTVAAIKQQDKNIVDKGQVILEKMLYEGHPYSLRPLGEIANIKEIERDQLLDYYEKHFVPEDAVLTIVGDVSAEEAMDDVKRRFSSWKRKNITVDVPEVPEIKGRKEKEVLMEKEQSMVFIGFQGVDVSDEKTYVLDVLGSLLSGSDGLLFSLLREEDGLVYASNAKYSNRKNKGYFVMYAATIKDNIEEVKKRMFEAVGKIKNGKFSEDDLKASKEKLITLNAKSLQSNYALSQVMALDELYGLGYDDHRSFKDKIYSVTKEEIVKCCGDILDPDKCAVMIIKGRS